MADDDAAVALVSTTAVYPSEGKEFKDTVSSGCNNAAYKTKSTCLLASASWVDGPANIALKLASEPMCAACPLVYSA